VALNKKTSVGQDRLSLYSVVECDTTASLQSIAQAGYDLLSSPVGKATLIDLEGHFMEKLQCREFAARCANLIYKTKSTWLADVAGIKDTIDTGTLAI
jgi:hypothetical protein